MQMEIYMIYNQQDKYCSLQRITEHGVIAWHSVPGTDESLVNGVHADHFSFIDIVRGSVIDVSGILNWVSQST